MSCYHPLKGFPIGKTVNGKVDYHITSFNTDHIELRNGKWCDSGVHQIHKSASKFVRDSINIPCGSCIGCRLDYSRQWADRCLLELQYHEHSYFITLTYDDLNVPVSNFTDKETGEIGASYTLVKKDFQDFIKRLRKNYKYDNNIRYFMCGEYGDTTRRPHYHCIIFGLKLDDLVLLKQSGLGFNYYTSDFISKCWQHKGFILVTEVSWETCAYTARYVTKKLKGKASVVYDNLNIVPEFTLMSRKPGIGKEYYEDNKEKLYKYDYVSVGSENGSRRIRPSRYFDKLFDIDNPLELEKIKVKRTNIADTSANLKLNETDLDYENYLKVEENAKERSLKALSRKEI